VLSSDEKRLHIFSTIYNAETNEAVATAEQMALHVDSKAGKSVPAPEHVLSKLAAIAEAHAQLPAPEGVGRFVGQKRA